MLRPPLWSFMIVMMIGFACTNRKTEIPAVQRASITEIEAGIKNWIETHTSADGFFHLRDSGKEYRMKLVRVHTEYLSSLGPESSFACVDLAESGGDVYDVDFFLAGKPGGMAVTETSVHKLNGKPWYTWKQQPDKTWKRQPVKDAAPGLLGVVHGTDSFEFHYRVVIPELSGKARMWMPVATSNSFQEVTLTDVRMNMPYRMVKEKKFGNSILYAEPSASNRGDTIQLTYRVKRLEHGPVVSAGSADPADLLPHKLVPVGGRFTGIAQEAFRGRDGSDLMKARALYDYIIDNMRYMKYGNFGRGDSDYACDVKTGNCSEFHSFFISLARSSGIPARFAIGASIPSDRNDGGIDGYHCWAEFEADGKWWPVDISEANKYTALATYYFGHHPANRLEFSKGRDLEPDPLPASGPINFLAYPILENAGKNIPVRTTFTFRRFEKK